MIDDGDLIPTVLQIPCTAWHIHLYLHSSHKHTHSLCMFPKPTLNQLPLNMHKPSILHTQAPVH